MHVELAQGIHDGEEPVSGQGNQREDGHANGHVFDELGECAEDRSPGPGGERVDGGRQRNCGHNHQEISQGQGQNVAAEVNSGWFRSRKH